MATSVTTGSMVIPVHPAADRYRSGRAEKRVIALDLRQSRPAVCSAGGLVRIGSDADDVHAYHQRRPNDMGHPDTGMPPIVEDARGMPPTGAPQAARWSRSRAAS
jgi:hypothetical protein